MDDGQCADRVALATTTSRPATIVKTRASEEWVKKFTRTPLRDRDRDGAVRRGVRREPPPVSPSFGFAFC